MEKLKSKSDSVYDQPSRSPFGEEQTCGVCGARRPISEMNVPNRKNKMLNKKELRGVMFICDVCKEDVLPHLMKRQ